MQRPFKPMVWVSEPRDDARTSRDGALELGSEIGAGKQRRQVWAVQIQTIVDETAAVQ